MTSYSMEEVQKHTTENDIWVVIDDKVLDVTSFLPDHPGGKLAILTFGGKDASHEFNMVHPPGVIEKYAPEAVIGTLGAAAAAPEPVADKKPDPTPAADSKKEPLLPKPAAVQEEEEGYFTSCVAMVWCFLVQIFKTIFFTGNFVFNNDRVGLTRSAFFLIMFMVIHAVGNLHVFLGPDDFNGYGYFYVRLYWTGFGLDANIVEEYVALAAVLHVLVGLKRTWDINITMPVSSGKLNLAFSGLWLLVYMTIHLQQFRFGATQPYAIRPPPTLINPEGINPFSDEFLNLFWVRDKDVPFVNVRDIYKLEFDLFQDIPTVIYYELSVAFFLWHYCMGWAKVVPAGALGIPKSRQRYVIFMGYVIGAFVALCYFAFPIYCTLVDPSPGFYGQEETKAVSSVHWDKIIPSELQSEM